MNKSNSSGKYVIITILVVLVGAGAFYGFTLYQKSQGPSAVATTGGGVGGGGPGGSNGFAARFGGGGIGSVTSVSSTSITITPRSRGGTTASPKTYAINSSTTATKDSSTAAVSDIAVGDTVLIRTSTDDTSTATAITINPSFGGGAGGPNRASNTGN